MAGHSARFVLCTVSLIGPACAEAVSDDAEPAHTKHEQRELPPRVRTGPTAARFAGRLHELDSSFDSPTPILQREHAAVRLSSRSVDFKLPSGTVYRRHLHENSVPVFELGFGEGDMPYLTPSGVLERQENSANLFHIESIKHQNEFPRVVSAWSLVEKTRLKCAMYLVDHSHRILESFVSNADCAVQETIENAREHQTFGCARNVTITSSRDCERILRYGSLSNRLIYSTDERPPGAGSETADSLPGGARDLGLAGGPRTTLSLFSENGDLRFRTRFDPPIELVAVTQNLERSVVKVYEDNNGGMVQKFVLLDPGGSSVGQLATARRSIVAALPKAYPATHVALGKDGPNNTWSIKVFDLLGDGSGEMSCEDCSHGHVAMRGDRRLFFDFYFKTDYREGNANGRMLSLDVTDVIGHRTRVRREDCALR